MASVYEEYCDDVDDVDTKKCVQIAKDAPVEQVDDIGEDDDNIEEVVESDDVMPEVDTEMAVETQPSELLDDIVSDCVGSTFLGFQRNANKHACVRAFEHQQAKIEELQREILDDPEPETTEV